MQIPASNLLANRFPRFAGNGRAEVDEVLAEAILRSPRLKTVAESGSLALRLTGSPPDTPVPLLEPTLARLHAEQAIYMVNSFQFTRSARLILVTGRKGAGFKAGR
jgi:hypothetical protein